MRPKFVTLLLGLLNGLAGSRRRQAAVPGLFRGIAMAVALGGLSACEGANDLVVWVSPPDPTPQVRMLRVPSSKACPKAGVLVKAGLDANANGQLDDSEVSSVRSFCYGEVEAELFMHMNPEPKGEHCPQGGTEVMVGLDSNGNGSFGANEVMATAYVCSGNASTFSARFHGSGAVPRGA